MRAKIEVTIPKPKFMEWEEQPVIPRMNNPTRPKEMKGTVNHIPEASSTSIHVVKDRCLTQKLNKVLENDEHLSQKSLSRQELEATFNNYSPIMLNMLKDELAPKEVNKTEEEKKLEEVEEQKFLEQQRTSSLGSRAKSRSNKNTPESGRGKDIPSINFQSKCFNKLDFEKFDKDEFLEKNRISEEESADETQYSHSIESKTSYRPINKQSPF
jgi:hypothetical protein